MKLYATPGSCSTAVHIALREADLPFQSITVDLATRKLPDGGDFTFINSKGYVPVLEVDDGQILTEMVALMMYIADQVPEKNLAPASDSLTRYRFVEWLAFISTEIHKSFSPLFAPGASEEAKNQARTRVMLRLKWVDQQLTKQTYLLGDQFSLADAYLFVVAGWSQFTALDISELGNLIGYLKRLGDRPAVQAALRADGLSK